MTHEGEFTFVTGIELGTSIAEALGIDPTQVSKMMIEMDAQGPAYVIVEAFVPATAGREMAIEVQRYKLVQDGQAVLDG